MDSLKLYHQVVVRFFLLNQINTNKGYQSERRSSTPSNKLLGGGHLPTKVRSYYYSFTFLPLHLLLYLTKDMVSLITYILPFIMLNLKGNPASIPIEPMLISWKW